MNEEKSVCWYYSDELSEDTEGNLVALCDACADENSEIVQHASNDEYLTMCDLCDW